MVNGSGNGMSLRLACFLHDLICGDNCHQGKVVMQSTNSDPEGIGTRLRFDSVVVGDGDYLREIGPAGLVFASRLVLNPGAAIELHIPIALPALETHGRVVWCRPEGDHFIVGVEFSHRIDRFQARMIWQVCRIEHYRKTVQEREGRELTRQEAAVEWIKLHARDFPKLDDLPKQ